MKTALVTGGNKGLGFEICRQLGEKGFKVYLAARDETRGMEAVKRLTDEGLTVHFTKMDITKTQEIRNLVDKLQEEDSLPDIIVNNAGVFLEDSFSAGEGASILKVDPVIILKSIEVNTLGALKVLQAFIPLIAGKKELRIINISSGMGQLESMNGKFPGYRMSKVSLNALTCILQDELDGSNIYVNSVCPGWVKTDMGGEDADREPKDAVETVIWLATKSNPPKGKFFRDKKEIAW